MRFLLLSFALAAPAKDTTSTVPTRRPNDQEQGQALWAQSCSACHGKDGRGDGPAVADLVGGIAPLAGKIPEDGEMDRVIDLVQAGRGRMPAFSETIDRPDTRRVLVYIRERMEGHDGPPERKAAEEPEEPGAEGG